MTATKPEMNTVPQTGERHLRSGEPFELVDELQEEMVRAWGEAWPLLSLRLRRLTLAPHMWAPGTDVSVKNHTLVVKAELPGVNKEDIELTLDQGDLLIHGEHKAESAATEEASYRVARSYGRFYRRLPLPFEANAEQIAASYTAGVLEVRIPTAGVLEVRISKLPQEQAQLRTIALR
jgi:HSP20 family protein